MLSGDFEYIFNDKRGLKGSLYAIFILAYSIYPLSGKILYATWNIFF